MKSFLRILQLITALSALAAALLVLYVQAPKQMSERTAPPQKEVSGQPPNQFDFQALARNVIKTRKPTELSNKKPSFQHANTSRIVPTQTTQRRRVTQPTRPVYVPEVQTAYRPIALPSRPARTNRTIEEPAETEKEEAQTYAKPKVVVSFSQTQSQTQSGGGTQTQSQSQGATVIYRKP